MIYDDKGYVIRNVELMDTGHVVQRHVHVGKNDKLISAQASADNLSFFINDNLLSAQRHVCVGTP